MNLPNISTRGLSIFAAVTGVAWGMQSALSLAFSDPQRFLDVLMFVPFSLTLIGVTAVHLKQRNQAVKIERIGFRIVAVAGAAGLIGQAALVADVDELVWISFPVGILALLVGLVMFGIGTVKTKVLPRNIGIALALAQPLAFAAGVMFIPISPISDYGDYSGAIGHALAWFMIARELRIRGEAATDQEEQRAVALAA